MKTQSIAVGIQISLIWLLKLIPLNLLRKLWNVSSMAPRLQALFLPNRGRKASQPSLTRQSVVYFLARLLMNDLPEVFDIWMFTNIIVDRSQLDELPEKSDSSLSAEILMTNYSLANGFGLVFGRAVVLKEVESLEAALKLKRKAG